MLKKILAILLAACLCISITACSSSDDASTSNSGDTGSLIDVSVDTEDAESTGANSTGESSAETGDLLAQMQGLPETLENPNIKIVYWYNPDQYAYDTSKNADVYDPILEAIPYFEEKYGGEVEVIYAAWADMLSTVISLQQSNEAPDLFETFDETLYNVALSGVAQPLDDYITEQDMSYYPIDKSTYMWEGSTYAIPLKPYARYIMFNRDLFELEGLKTPDEMFRDGEWNWDTFRDVCQTLTKTVDGAASQLAFGARDEALLFFLYSNGTTLLNVDTAAGTVSSNLGSQEALNTLDFMVELKDSFVLGDDVFGWFDEGNLAMICGKEFPVELPFEVGMVPFPAGDDYEGKNLVVYPQGMSVPNGASNPEGAVAFMRIVNELQQLVGNTKEANRIGQENYAMIYSDDVKQVYGMDLALNDPYTIIASITNYINDGVPAATINANMKSVIQGEIDLRYGS